MYNVKGFDIMQTHMNKTFQTELNVKYCAPQSGKYHSEGVGEEFLVSEENQPQLPQPYLNNYKIVYQAIFWI